MIRKERGYSGTKSTAVTRREEENRALARRAAAEGMVLLKNDGVLPLARESAIALFGSGALHMVKGGTGSGDVNEREVVGIAHGMQNAGFHVVNEQWLREYETEYRRARQEWKTYIQETAAKKSDSPWDLVEVYVTTPRTEPVGRHLSDEEIARLETDTAIYVLSRVAGEGADRRDAAGDYELREDEKDFLRHLRAHFKKLIVLLNCGGQIDLRFLDELGINALLLISQPGMEGGNAVADILSGAVNPSGKLTATWAYRYEDYPSADTFGHRNGDTDTEVYAEDIYMGYRYFDTFGIAPRFPFGFGLSYTKFTMDCGGVRVKKDDGMPEVELDVTVKNIGSCAGREVVQIYTECPQTDLPKERKRLCAFGKTPLLEPNASCTLTVRFSVELLTSFPEGSCAYVLDAGDYVLHLGSSSRETKAVGVIRLSERLDTKIVAPICPIKAPFARLEAPKWRADTPENVPILVLPPDSIPQEFVLYREDGKTDETFVKVTESARSLKKAMELASSLRDEQLISLTCGDPGKGQESAETFGSSGISVPGSAGETHNCAQAEPWNLASIVLADGPAGLRLAREYPVRPDGSIVKQEFLDSIERGLFSNKTVSPEDTIYHQYCTAFPVGTALAQSWDTALLYRVGAAVAREMEEFGVTLWLAPGMNLQRNPLCGRNFEYYSEDPLLSGLMAAVITKGVQENGHGVGTTIKHFACNSVEDNRKGNNSVVSERALRELYLRGFEIAVRSAQPMAVMTSYNLINGVHAANSADLVKKVLRREWGFEGIVVTDWSTTGEGGSDPAECIRSGHNLIMPGTHEDLRLIREALARGTLDKDALLQSVSGLVRVILLSREYENAKPYAAQFDEPRIPPYVGGEPYGAQFDTFMDVQVN